MTFYSFLFLPIKTDNRYKQYTAKSNRSGAKDQFGRKQKGHQRGKRKRFTFEKYFLFHLCELLGLFWSDVDVEYLLNFLHIKNLTNYDDFVFRMFSDL